MSKLQLFNDYKEMINNYINTHENIIKNNKVVNVKLHTTFKKLKEETAKYINAMKTEDGREAQERKEQKEQKAQQKLEKPPKQKGGNSELLERLKKLEEEAQQQKQYIQQLEDTIQTSNTPKIQQKGGDLKTQIINNAKNFGVPMLPTIQKHQKNDDIDESSDTFMNKLHKKFNISNKRIG